MYHQCHVAAEKANNILGSQKVASIQKHRKQFHYTYALIRSLPSLDTESSQTVSEKGRENVDRNY